MEVDSNVYGILNYEQLERFCERMNVIPSTLRANFDGWRKLVLISKDRVFLFPRDPQRIEGLDLEATAYEIMNDYPELPVPKFIERVKDTQISYYEFVVISKLEGTAYAKYEKEVNADDVNKMLTNLAEVFAQWHNMEINDVPSKIYNSKIFNLVRYKWEEHILESDFQEAYDVIVDKVMKKVRELTPNLLDTLNSDKVDILWKECLLEIRNLSPVFLHCDIHEDQILVESKESMKITGIIDWETVRVGNPVWEFNFYEWGFGIWKWSKNFPKYRRRMWEIYLEKRNIDLKYKEGLDLFYTLSEFLIVLNPETTLTTLIGENQEESIKICLERLAQLTSKMEKERFSTL